MAPLLRGTHGLSWPATELQFTSRAAGAAGGAGKGPGLDQLGATDNNIKGEMGQFCMLMKLSWNKFKLHCYKFRTFIVIPMETTEKISKSYIQKQMRR